jgi:hypothetical protein
MGVLTGPTPVVLYAVSWCTVVVLAYFPPRGLTAARDRAAVFLSLPALLGVALVRSGMVGDSPSWALWGGLALNLSILVGTRLDPVVAVVNWDKRPAPDDPRHYRAWPTLSIFVVLLIIVWIVGSRSHAF